MQTQTGIYTNYLAIFAADDVEAKSGVSFVDDNCSRLSVNEILHLETDLVCEFLSVLPGNVFVADSSWCARWNGR